MIGCALDVDNESFLATPSYMSSTTLTHYNTFADILVHYEQYSSVKLRNNFCIYLRYSISYITIKTVLFFDFIIWAYNVGSANQIIYDYATNANPIKQKHTKIHQHSVSKVSLFSTTQLLVNELWNISIWPKEVVFGVLENVICHPKIEFLGWSISILYKISKKTGLTWAN